MKPMFLRLKAFGPFANEVSISFDRVYDGGLFLIHGRTGAGKTSLLDGICFSLFGRPSSEEREKDLRGLRSDLADPALMTETELVFSIGSEAFRVHRIPSQPAVKKRGEGFTEHKGTAELYRLEGDVRSISGVSDFTAQKWIPLAGKVEAVDLAIENLMGMNEQQFRQVVVLPQGKFREFLSSTSSDRQIILEKLFQTDRFSKLQQFITSRARSTQSNWEAASGKLQAKLNDFGLSSFEDIAARKNDTDVALEAVKKDLASARSQSDTLTLRFNQAQEFEAASARLLTLRAEADRLKAEASEIADADQTVKSARAWAPYFQMEDAVKSALEKNAELEVRSLAATTEAQHANLKDAELQKFELDLLAISPSTEQMSVELSRLRDLVPILRDIAKFKDQLATEDALNVRAKNDEKVFLSEQVSLEQTQTASVELAFAIDEALRTHEARLLETALRASNELELKFHVSEAGRLAAILEPGQPCPVCGSEIHPRLASRSLHSDTGLTSEHVAKTKADLEKLRISTSEKRSKRQAQLDRLENLRPSVLKPLPNPAKETDASFSAAFFAFEKAADRKQVVLQNLNLLRERLVTRGEVKMQLLRSLEEKVALVPPADRSLSEITERGVQLKATKEKRVEEIREVSSKRSKTTNEVARLNGLIAALSDERKRHASDLARLQQELKTLEVSLLKTGSTETRPSTQIDARKLASLEAEIERHKKAEAGNQAATGEIENRLSHMPPVKLGPSVQNAVAISRDLEIANRVRQDLEERVTRLKVEAESLVKLEVEAKLSGDKLGMLKDEAERAVRMSALLSGDRSQNKLLVPLSRFVLQRRFDDVLDQANRRLSRMSRGQFQLRRPALSKNLRDSQGLEIRVEDSNAGTERHAGSLSGGESFMAALSLALGLADVVQADLGGIKIDSVLIDEGFGTLDSESLDLAMKTLVDLQAGGRIVGIISHVQELKAQVQHRLEVEKTARGSRAAWNDSAHVRSEPSRDVAL